MFVPHELIIEILLRLPVKSLTRFKCVCKLWFSLISHDSHFANSHFQLTPNRRILFISKSNHEARSIEASLHDDSASVSLNLNFMFPEDFINYAIKGSCRGFILICCWIFNIYIWNPSTGVHKQIPLSPFGFNLDAKYLYGFGYDDSTDDYLVVSLSQHDNLDDPTLHLEYFSLKANTWKVVEDPHFPCTFQYEPKEPKGGSLYKGAIHWLGFNNDYACEVIVAFNLMERKLSYMHLPCFNPSHCDLWVYGEFLSVYIMNYSNDTLEIWVMKEYKVDSSWVMTLVLPIDLIPTKDFSLLCYTKSGDIIGIGTEDGVGLVKCYENEQFIEQHYYSNHDLRLQVIMYIDSLLSLPSDGDNEQD